MFQARSSIKCDFSYVQFFTCIGEPFFTHFRQCLHFFSQFRAQYCCHPFHLKLKPSTSQPTHFREIFRKSSHHVNTNKGSVVKQSGNDVEGCRSQKVLFQPNRRVFLQYSVKFLSDFEHSYLSQMTTKNENQCIKI